MWWWNCIVFECEHNQTNLILSSYFKFEASYGLERQFNTIEIPCPLHIRLNSEKAISKAVSKWEKKDELLILWNMVGGSFYIKEHQCSFVIFTSHWLHFLVPKHVRTSLEWAACKIYISQQTAYHFEETMNAASTNTQEVHKCCEIHKDRKRNSSFRGQ